MKPLVSVCCITYNQEKYVEETLKGFLIQKTTFPIEILIHDDASTDSTPQILKKYEEMDDRISVLYQTENKYSKGEKPFINYLFPKAKGKYIAMCEGDDYWIDPLKLQKQIDFLESNPEYILTHHDAKVIDEREEIINESKLKDKYKNELSEISLKKAPQLLTLTLCFRNIIRDFNQKLFQVKNGDSMLLSLLGNYGKAKFQPGIIPAVYRVHGGGVWSSIGDLKRLQNSYETFVVLQKYHFQDDELRKHFNLKLRNNQLAKLKYVVRNNPGNSFEVISRIWKHGQDRKINTFWQVIVHAFKGVLNIGLKD